jgi:Uma2 family endonuclease
MTAHDQLDGQAKHRLTVQEFLLLDSEGAFGTRSTELIGGEVFYMSPKHRPHARAITQMVIALSKALERGDFGLSILTDISLHASEHDVPEPDIVLTDAPDGDGILPLAAAKLVIEVSQSTLKTDLGVKADLYARVGVPEYWVIDLTENRALLHANPRPDGSGYDGQLDVSFGEPLHAATIEGLTVETEGLG